MSDQARLMIAAGLMAVLLLVSWNLLGSRQGGSSTVEESPDDVTADELLGPDAPGPALVEDPVPVVADSTTATGVTAMADSGMAVIPVDTLPVPEEVEIGVTILSEDENALVRATIGSRGGCLSSWELVGFADLSEGAAQDSGLQLLSGSCFPALDTDGNPVAFEFDSDMEEIVVRSDSLDVVLRAGGDHWRVYRFYRNSYEFRLADSSYEWTSLPSRSLPVTESDVTASRYFRAAWHAEKVKQEDGRKVGEDRPVGRVLWIGARSKYFCVLFGAFDSSRSDGYVVPGGEDGSPGVLLRSSDIRVYAGPIDYGRLRDFGDGADQLVDFGWPIIRWIGMVIFWFSNSVLSFVGNWGVRIILVSIALKVVLLPLTQKSFKSIRKMQLLQPRLKELQQKYKNEPLKQREALAKLYRDEKVNPMGGCLPLLLQMPVFFALYRVLSGSVQLRGAPFLLWITDLSRPEVLFSFGGSVLGLSGMGLLPVMMGLAMFFQQKMSATDPKQKSMMYIMPIFMTWLFMRFPAGLTLYWFVNNILTIAQQEIIKLSERRTSPVAESSTSERPGR